MWIRIYIRILPVAHPQIRTSAFYQSPKFRMSVFCMCVIYLIFFYYNCSETTTNDKQNKQRHSCHVV